jgi:hypothetical protein
MEALDNMRKPARQVPEFLTEDIKDILKEQLSPRNITKGLFGVDVIDELHGPHDQKSIVDVDAIINTEYLRTGIKHTPFTKKVDISDYEYD